MLHNSSYHSLFPRCFCLFSLNQGEGTVHLTVCWFSWSEVNYFISSKNITGLGYSWKRQSRPTAERDIVPSDLTTPVLRSASVLFSTLSVRPLTTNWDVLGWNCVCLTSALEFALSVLCLSFLVYVGGLTVVHVCLPKSGPSITQATCLTCNVVWTGLDLEIC